MKIIKQSPRILDEVVGFLKKGGVAICPTDTVYGFLADGTNKKAVDKIYKIKKRSKSKPLSIFVRDLNMANKIAMIDKRQAKILRKFWPGKVTAILKTRLRQGFGEAKKNQLKLYGVRKDTLAIRIPNHRFLQKLLKKISRPLVQTSVNISRQEPLNNVDQIVATFGKSKLVGLIIEDSEGKEDISIYSLPNGEDNMGHKPHIIDGGDIKNPSRRSGQAAKPSKIVDLTENSINIIRK